MPATETKQGDEDEAVCGIVKCQMNSLLFSSDVPLPEVQMRKYLKNRPVQSALDRESGKGCK